MHHLWAWYPPVGVFIGILGLLGVLVPLLRDLGKIGKGERAIWTLIFFALVLLEIKSIYQDRNAHDEAQALARMEQLNQFKMIADGINTSIQTSQRHYDATISKVSTVLDTAQEVAKLSQKNLENITGGNSFGFIVPQVDGTQDVPLVVWNHGDQVLSGVTISISRTQDPNWGREFYHPIFIGTIGPHCPASVGNGESVRPLR